MICPTGGTLPILDSTKGTHATCHPPDVIVFHKPKNREGTKENRDRKTDESFIERRRDEQRLMLRVRLQLFSHALDYLDCAAICARSSTTKLSSRPKKPYATVNPILLSEIKLVLTRKGISEGPLGIAIIS